MRVLGALLALVLASGVASAELVAVNPTGPAQAELLAVSGTGDAGASGTCAAPVCTAGYAASGTGGATAGCTRHFPDACGTGAAASGLGAASGDLLGASGTGPAECTAFACVAASGLGDARACEAAHVHINPHPWPDCVAASLAGDATCAGNICVAASGTGDAACEQQACVALSGTGHASGGQARFSACDALPPACVDPA
jgi:hypothetical protein